MNATSVADCLCDRLFYKKSQDAGNCHHCPLYAITSSIGTVGIEACTCDAGANVRRIGNLCGCVDGLYMDHVVPTCRVCLICVRCIWFSNATRGLLPPGIYRGFWALTHPVATVANFSEHDIIRCFSSRTCKADNVCARRRSGRACSLCEPGNFGGPDGDCRECGVSPDGMTAIAVFLVVMAILMLIPAQRITIVDDKFEFRNGRQTVKTLKTSAKQLIKFSQIMSIVSLFEVAWPVEAMPLLNATSVTGSAIRGSVGVACLDDQQSVGLELGFLWAFPLLMVFLILPAGLLASVVGKVCGAKSLFPEASSQNMMRLAFLIVGLLFTCTVQGGLMLMTCRQSPNGDHVVASFPHMTCLSSAWLKLLPFAVAITVGVVLIFLAFNWYALRQLAFALGRSNGKSRGEWAFAFQEYRSCQSHWLLCVLARDLCCNLIPVLVPNDGATQVTLLSYLILFYVVSTFMAWPFLDQANNALEVWTMFIIFLTCNYAGAMGFVDSFGNGVPFEDGENNSTYKSRVLWLVCIQSAGVAGAAAILFHQVLSSHSAVIRGMPRPFRPLSASDLKQQRANFLHQVGTFRRWRKVVHRFDGMEWRRFDELVTTSMATIRILDAQRSATISQSVGSMVSSFEGRTSAGAGDTDKQEGGLPSRGAAEPASTPQSMNEVLATLKQERESRVGLVTRISELEERLAQQARDVPVVRFEVLLRLRKTTEGWCVYGIETTPRASDLVVTGVSRGAVQEWNRSNSYPDRVVQKGDRIVQVQEVAGTGACLTKYMVELAACGTEDSIKLCMERDGSWKDTYDASQARVKALEEELANRTAEVSKLTAQRSGGQQQQKQSVSEVL